MATITANPFSVLDDDVSPVPVPAPTKPTLAATKPSAPPAAATKPARGGKQTARRGGRPPAPAGSEPVGSFLPEMYSIFISL